MFKMNWFVSLNTPEGNRNYSGAVDFDNLLYIQKVAELAGENIFQQIANSYGLPTQSVNDAAEDEPQVKPENKEQEND